MYSSLVRFLCTHVRKPDHSSRHGERELALLIQRKCRDIKCSQSSLFVFVVTGKSGSEINKSGSKPKIPAKRD